MQVPICKITKEKGLGSVDVAQVVRHLPRKCKALSYFCDALNLMAI
jgi:hypothetical protein